MRVKTQEEFLKQCIGAHGSTYDYSLVVYLGNKKKVAITCSTHGIFMQTPDAHIRGQGCPKCVVNLGRSTNTKYSTLGFIEEATKIHCGMYDYTTTECSGSLAKVNIICKKHGKFSQRASEHLAGRGCQLCARELNSLRGISTLAEVAKASALKAGRLFIGNSRDIHGELYKYDKVEYINNHTKIVIICSKHGDFLQTPSGHLMGKGCPACALERSNIAMRMSEKNTLPTLLYYLYFPEINLWKIGCTSRTIEERFKQEKLEYQVIFTKEYSSGQEAYSIEKVLLDYTKEHQFTGKVLGVKGNSELRTQPVENLAYLLRKAESLYNSLEEDYINH